MQDTERLHDALTDALAFFARAIDELRKAR